MNSIERIYLQLLQRSIWGERLAGNGERLAVRGEDMPELMMLCRKQGTEALVYNEILKLAKTNEGEMDAALLMQMKQIGMQHMLSYDRKISMIREVWGAMQAKMLHPVLLKGFALARLYPLPYLRSWGDMDVIVPIEEHEAACEVMHHLRPNVKIMAEACEGCKHEVAYIDDQVVELHQYSLVFYHPKDRAYYHQIEQEGLQPNKVEMIKTAEGLEVAVPQPELNFLHVFAHAREHLEGTGMPMKQLCDLALMAHEYAAKMDWKQLETNLIKLHLLELWQTIGWVCVNALGLPQNEWPMYDEGAKNSKRGDRLLAHVLAEGQCRPHGPAFWQEGYVTPRGGYIGRKWATLVSRYKEMQRMWPFSPKYAIRYMEGTIVRGIQRTMKGDRVLEYRKQTEDNEGESHQQPANLN